MGRLRHRTAIGCTYFVMTKALWVAWDTWASLLTGWRVVAALAAGEVANAEQLGFVADLGAPDSPASVRHHERYSSIHVRGIRRFAQVLVQLNSPAAIGLPRM